MTDRYVSRYFKASEIACKCECGLANMDINILLVADAIREREGRPVDCNSGCRCVDHNVAVQKAYFKEKYKGQGAQSRHLPRAKKYKHQTIIQSDAMDLDVMHPKDVAKWLDEHYPHISYIVYETFIHIDNRPETYKKP